MNKKRSARKFLIAFAVGMVIAVGVFAARGGLEYTDTVPVLQAFCDAFFVPGILFMGFGALLFCADDGLFDMMNYGVMKVINLSRSKKHRDAFPKSFYDYRQMKDEKRKGGFGYLFIVGGGFMALAVLFLILSEM